MSSLSSMYAGLSGSYRLVTQPYVGSGGSWQPCRFVYAGEAGSWQQIFKQEDPLSVSAPDVSQEDDVFGFPSQHVSGGTTATPAGGSGSYSYLWTWLGGATDVTIDNATLQSPTWTTPLIAPEDSRSASWRCTVTDSESHTAHCDIAITLIIHSIND